MYFLSQFEVFNRLYPLTKMEREFSDLSMSRKECKKCGAVWINGQHMWATGNKGNEKDLAGLVCNNLGDENCINPCRGAEGGRHLGRSASPTSTPTLR